MSEQVALSNALHAQAQSLIASGADRSEWKTFASQVIAYQRNFNSVVHRLANRRGIDAAELNIAHIPALPTDAFKQTRVSCIAEGSAAARFRTSGTTLGARGVHEFASLQTYHAGALQFGAAQLLQPLQSARVRVLVLGPSARTAPDSSLASMNTLFERTWSAARGAAYLIETEQLDLAAVQAAVARAHSDGLPVLLLATSFALVHLLEALDSAKLPLPPGSRVMQTGGFKGKSREVERAALNLQLCETLQVGARCICSEYGMTELSSQFYAVSDGAYAEPPWAWITAVDPETLEPVADGEIGIARIDDCLNIDSAIAIQTQDRVRRSASSCLVGCRGHRRAAAQLRWTKYSQDERASQPSGAATPAGID
jgi:hypothetical protein